jgi:diketogulonate reductase-like aldo/keto reductase
MADQLFIPLNNGISMPLLGLGAYDIHKEEVVRTVLTAIETGYRLIDTAEMYGNERAIGEGIRKSGVRRSDLFITTKVNNPDHGYEATLRAFEQSEKRINCGYIDLYLIHWPIKPFRRDTWRALEQLYADGRVKAIGVANYLIPFLNELETYASVVPAVDQVEFSPYLYLRDLVAYCETRRIQLQAYTPLARGRRLRDPRLVGLAGKYGKTPAQIMLRWIIQHGVSAIPKSSNPQRLRENFNIFDFQLDAHDVASMDQFHENLRLVPDPLNLL